MEGEMTVSEAGSRGGKSTSKPKQDAARSNGSKTKRKRIDTLLDKKVSKE